MLLNLLVYADDTVILAETSFDLIISLNRMAEYYENWSITTMIIPVLLYGSEIWCTF